MGLDMYAWAVPADSVPADQEVDVEFGNCGTEELHYWRKHHDLHGWMEALYRKKGGADPQFNCNKVRLTAEDLDALEKDITADHLPETTGFFFGNNPPDEDSREDDREFIRKARVAIADGKAVFYDSWW